MKILFLLFFIVSCANFSYNDDKRYQVQLCIEKLSKSINEELAANHCSIFYGFDRYNQKIKKQYRRRFL